jgi:hypothetical protein
MFKSLYFDCNDSTFMVACSPCETFKTKVLFIDYTLAIYPFIATSSFSMFSQLIEL